MKSSIISIFKSYSVILLFLFIFPLPSKSDEMPLPGPFFSVADFEDEFPPEGWKILTKTGNHLWEKTDSVVGWEIIESNSYFASIGQKELEPFDEILITDYVYIWETVYENDGISGEWIPHLNFDLAFERMETDDVFDFVVEICRKGDDNWKRVFSLQNYIIKYSREEYFDYFFHYNLILMNYQNQYVRFAFRYIGNEGSGIALDNIFFNMRQSSKKTNDCEEDDCSIPIDAIHENSVPGGDSEVCGIVFQDPAAPLALFMVLIGIVSLLISKRRFHL